MMSDEQAALECRELERLLTVEFECNCCGITLCKGCRMRVLAAEVKRMRAELASHHCDSCDGSARECWQDKREATPNS